jgi:hypothetical protein
MPRIVGHGSHPRRGGVERNLPMGQKATKKQLPIQRRDTKAGGDTVTHNIHHRRAEGSLTPSVTPWLHERISQWHPTGQTTESVRELYTSRTFLRVDREVSKFLWELCVLYQMWLVGPWARSTVPLDPRTSRHRIVISMREREPECGRVDRGGAYEFVTREREEVEAVVVGKT